MSAIDELQSAITSVAERVGPSVVGIGSRQRGSGLVVGDGKVLTNAHNVRGDEVTVTFADGRTTRGRLGGVDVDGDLAVINVDTAGAPSLEWADGAAVTPGTLVFAASADSGGGARVTFGTISAVARAFRGPGGRRIAGSDRAHRADGARLLGWSDRRRERQAPRHQHQPPRRGLLPRDPDR